MEAIEISGNMCVFIGVGGGGGGGGGRGGGTVSPQNFWKRKIRAKAMTFGQKQWKIREKSNRKFGQKQWEIRAKGYIFCPKYMPSLSEFSHCFCPNFPIAFARNFHCFCPNFPLLFPQNLGKSNWKFCQKQWINLCKSNEKTQKLSGGIYFGQKFRKFWAISRIDILFSKFTS